MDIGVKNGRIVGVRGLETDRANRGRLGPKGLHGWQANHSGDRLTEPLIRDGAGFRAASWEEAMNLAVSRCRETIEQFSPSSVGVYTSGQLFLEEYYTLSMICYAGLRTDQVDGNTRLCTATASQALRETFGSDGQPGSYSDIDETDCLFIVGNNMAETGTVLWMRVLDRLAGHRRPKLIVIDPRTTPTAAAADVHLAPRPGTNVALLNGLLHLLIKKGHHDRAFIDQHTVSFDKLERVVHGYTPEYVRVITGIHEETLLQAAEILGTSPTLTSTVLQGVYQSNQATAAACQVNNIHLVLGKIGKPGSGVIQMNGQPTSENTRETGCDGEFPFFANYQNPQHIERWSRAWNVDPITLPCWHVHAHSMEIFRNVELGSVRFLWVQATNPAVSLPELHRVRATLEQDRLFLVVRDAFLTETAKLADVILPAAIWGEKTGTFTNIDRTVHLSRKAIEPPGEARTDLDIFLDFARRMDYRDKDGQPLIKWNDAEGAFNHWARCSKGFLVDYSGMTYEMLSQGTGIQWPCNEQFPDGCERLYSDHQFHTSADITQSFGHDIEIGAARSPDEYRAHDPGGRAILKPAHYIPPVEETDAEYPLLLTTGRVVYHFHTRTKTGRCPELEEAAPDVFVQLSQPDAEKYGIAEGDQVEITSRRGSVLAAAKVGNIPPGQVFLPFHYGYWDEASPDYHRAANELTITDWDPVSKQPYFKYAAVRMQKAPGMLSQIGGAMADAASKTVERGKELVGSLLNATHTDARSHVPDTIGEVRDGMTQFAEACRTLKSQHFEELAYVGTWETLARWCDELNDELQPFADKYGEANSGEMEHLRKTLFAKTRTGAFGLFRDLQSLEVLASAVHGANTVLHKVSMGLHDPGLHATTLHADEQIRRAQAWILTHIKHRAVHTMLVPE